MGLTSGVQAITAGEAHTCALTKANGIKCWGSNFYGQLGDNTTTDHHTPVDVIGLSGGAQDVTAGNGYTCAVTMTNGVKCWGNNSFGQLGDGSQFNRTTPVDVVGLTSGVQAIVAGGSYVYYTCALTKIGGVKCWGSNEFGQLGDGTQTEHHTPVDVTGLSSGVQAIAAGYENTCALTMTNGVKCWGDNEFGQLGDSTQNERTTPVDVTGLSSGVQAVTIGEGYTCALLTKAGDVKCWGNNDAGQLGNGTQAEHNVPVNVKGLTAGVRDIGAGHGYSCALTELNGVKCWGFNYYGQLGDGTTTDRNAPVDVAGLTSGVQAISIGDGHACALTTANKAKCWGQNFDGQLGDGTSGIGNHRTTPVDVVALTGTIQAISVGSGLTCALIGAPGSGGVKCWGANESGQLGDGTRTAHTTPVDVRGLTSGVLAIATGSGYACALTTAHGVKCWGFNGSGQLGDGTTVDRDTPVDVSGLTSGVQAIAADATASDHTCALIKTGGVKCWGFNFDGQLGDGTHQNYHYTPVDVIGLSNAVQPITVNGSHTCALTGEPSGPGGIKCWGDNIYGELGDGTLTERDTPVDVVGLTSGVQSVTAGFDHTCALIGGNSLHVSGAGGVKCWGDNKFGQLGDGAAWHSAPVDVVFTAPVQKTLLPNIQR